MKFTERADLIEAHAATLAQQGANAELVESLKIAAATMRVERAVAFAEPASTEDAIRWMRSHLAVSQSLVDAQTAHADVRAHAALTISVYTRAITALYFQDAMMRVITQARDICDGTV